MSLSQRQVPRGMVEPYFGFASLGGFTSTEVAVIR